MKRVSVTAKNGNKLLVDESTRRNLEAQGLLATEPLSSVKTAAAPSKRAPRKAPARSKTTKKSTKE